MKFNNMSIVVIVVSFFMSFVFTACLEGLIEDSDDEEGDDEDNWLIEDDPDEAEKKCKDVLGWFCFEMNECFSELGMNDCEDAFGQIVQCEKAEKVYNSYLDCHGDISDMDCAEPDLPRSCVDGISFEDGAGFDELTGGGNPDGDIPDDGNGDAVAKCEAIYESMCGRIAYCMEQNSADPAAVDMARQGCLDQMGPAFNCDSATGYDDSAYDLCLMTIRGLSCDAASNLYVSECENVISY